MRVIKRMRWLFLSIVVIYAFSTPGEYIPVISELFSPTFEGLESGLLQVAKLTIAISCLSILFCNSSKEELMAGLYWLLFPLKIFQINIERFVARLLLTLDYVEALVFEAKLKLNFNSIDTLINSIKSTPDKDVCLQQPSFVLIDQFILCFIVLVMIVVIYLS